MKEAKTEKKERVDAFTHLKQRLEYFERHIQNSKNQELKKEYFRTLAQVIEAENALRNFVKVFYNDSSNSNIKNS